MKALVTGSAGFVGRALCRTLRDGGHEVRECDTLIGVPVEALVVGHVDSADVVFHLAAKVGVATAEREGVGVLEHNLSATRHLLQLLARYRAGARIVVVSSSEVYGDSEEQPCREDMPLRLPPPTDPRWAYTYSKAIDEMFALGMTRKGVLNAVVVRLFNVAGRGANRTYGAVLPALVGACRNGWNMPIHGDGEQTRSFVHVDDVAAALVLVADKGTVGEIYNIGSADEITINALATRVSRALGVGGATQHLPTISPATIGCRRRVADCTKLHALGWVPAKTLDDAIKDCLAGLEADDRFVEAP